MNRKVWIKAYDKQLKYQAKYHILYHIKYYKRFKEILRNKPILLKSVNPDSLLLFSIPEDKVIEVEEIYWMP